MHKKSKHLLLALVIGASLGTHPLIQAMQSPGITQEQYDDRYKDTPRTLDNLFGSQESLHSDKETTDDEGIDAEVSFLFSPQRKKIEQRLADEENARQQAHDRRKQERAREKAMFERLKAEKKALEAQKKRAEENQRTKDMFRRRQNQKDPQESD